METFIDFAAILIVTIVALFLRWRCKRSFFAECLP
jgi:hypothetical protein